MPATATVQRRRRRPKKFPYKPKPPPEPHPFLLHLKSLPSPVAAAASLLSAPRHLHDHPFAACVLYRLARARLFPLVPPLLTALRTLRVPLQPTAFAALIDHLGAFSRPDAALLVFRAVPAFCSHSNATFHALLHSRRPLSSASGPTPSPTTSFSRAFATGTGSRAPAWCSTKCSPAACAPRW